MKKETRQEYCLSCKKETEHMPYSESDTINYNGVQIAFEDKGYICTKCGDQYTPPRTYDAIMQEIRDTYNALLKKY